MSSITQDLHDRLSEALAELAGRDDQYQHLSDEELIVQGINTVRLDRLDLGRSTMIELMMRLMPHIEITDARTLMIGGAA